MRILSREQAYKGHRRPPRTAFVLGVLTSLFCAGRAIASTGAGRDMDHRAQLAAAVLAVHNQVRGTVKVPPVEWSDALADRAASWAGHLAQLGSMAHSGDDEGGDDGENIWIGSAGAFSYEMMMHDWVDEARFFRAGYFPYVSTTGNWQDTGHFTQMIWRETRHVGCALASGGGWDVLVCRYGSPGNVFGRKPY